MLTWSPCLVDFDAFPGPSHCLLEHVYPIHGGLVKECGLLLSCILLLRGASITRSVALILAQHRGRLSGEVSATCLYWRLLMLHGLRLDDDLLYFQVTAQGRANFV